MYPAPFNLQYFALDQKAGYFVACFHHQPGKCRAGYLHLFCCRCVIHSQVVSQPYSFILVKSQWQLLQSTMHDSHRFESGKERWAVYHFLFF
jgi:hypothetical protein